MPERSSQFELTLAKSTDLERMLAIHAAAFPGARSVAERRANFLDNPRGGASDLFVVRVRSAAREATDSSALREGDVVGHAFLFRMHMWIAGKSVPVGGVASIGVASEARGRGVGRTIVEGLVAESSRRGDALQLLYPFAQRFYAGFGFGPTAPVLRLRVAASALPHRELASMCVRVSPTSPSARASMLLCYGAAARRACGHLDRSDVLLGKMLALDGTFTFLVPGRGGQDAAARGYVSFSFVSQHQTGTTELDVRELVANDDEARRALIGVLAAHRDQVSAVELSVDLGDPLPLVVTEAHAPGAPFVPQHLHPIGAIGAGPLVRVIDPAAALRSRGYFHDGELDLRLTDGAARACGDASLRLTVRDGVGLVAPSPAASLAVADAGEVLALDVATLSAIVVGALRPSDAARHSLVRASDEALACADRIFDTRAPFRCLDEF